MTLDEHGNPIVTAVVDHSEDALDKEVDDLFKDPEDSQPQTNTSTEDLVDQSDKSGKDVMTQTMTNRINEVRSKTEKDTQDKIAKELGYADYATMKKVQTDKLVQENGFKPEDVEKILKPMLEERIKNDPRFKKLEDFEKREQTAYVTTSLANINKVTGQILTVDDLDKEVLNLWSKGVELEQAYYAIHGKTILTKGVNATQNGSMNHLAPGANAGLTKTRKLTDEEKAMYRSINPYITEEDLAKKTTVVDK